MKKLIVIVASLLVAVSAHAQLGVIAGITSAQTKFDNVDAAIAEAQNATQYHVGLTYKLGLGNLLAIQPSIIYNVKGSKVSAIAGLNDFDFKSGYLEVPVQLQVGVGLGDLARVYAIAEPFIGMAVTETTVKDIVGDQKIEWDDFSDRIEYGFGVGAGVELIKHVQVCARYFWNMGGAKDSKITVSNAANMAKDIVTNKKANGVMASVVLLF